MNCLHCGSERVVKNGTKTLKNGQLRQRYKCNDCKRRFNEVSGTPMARLRTPVGEIERAMKSRSEGLGIRATARVFGKSPSSITLWEERLSAHVENWSPAAPEGGSVTVEGDEVYTRVGENLSPK